MLGRRCMVGGWIPVDPTNPLGGSHRYLQAGWLHNTRVLPICTIEFAVVNDTALRYILGDCNVCFADLSCSSWASRICRKQAGLLTGN